MHVCRKEVQENIIKSAKVQKGNQIICIINFFLTKKTKSEKSVEPKSYRRTNGKGKLNFV